MTDSSIIRFIKAQQELCIRFSEDPDASQRLLDRISRVLPDLARQLEAERRRGTGPGPI